MGTKRLTASLMPPDTIFDYRHYANELTRICTAMDDFGLPELSQQAAQAVSKSQGLFRFGGVTTLLTMFGEIIVGWKVKML